jgi:ferrous iron transport protein B
MTTQKRRIALAGNPNSGKTTLFNSLTGSRQRVGNYPGITVEKREGQLKSNDSIMEVIDLPGTYSLTAYSQEELVARNVVVQDRPEVVVDVLDATNLERHLYLAVQFMELGIPVILALNMMDEVSRKGIELNTAKLSSLLGVPVLETIARTGAGRQELMSEALNIMRNQDGKVWHPLHISYGPDLDPVLEQMTQRIVQERFLTDLYPARWVALKYLEADQEIVAYGRKHGQLSNELEAMVEQVSDHCQKTLHTDPEGIIADYRYGFISSILRQGVLTRNGGSDRRDLSRKLDGALTHTFLGPVIMLGILYGLFHITFGIGEIPLGWVESFFVYLEGAAYSLLPEGLLRSLVVSGLIAGVGGVLTFVPLILIMFIGISILEDSGYTARMAYMLDRVFRVFGLHGSSIMPFIVSGGIPGGCAVPGVMAARTLRSPKEKLATLLTAPFLSCGAKVPVFLLMAAAFFPTQAAAVLFAITLLGWGAALFTAWLLRSTIITGESTPFVLELPPYRMPTIKGVLIHAWERAWQYIKKAGTIILCISVLIWAAMTFPDLPEQKASSYASRQAALQTQIDQAGDQAVKLDLVNKLNTLRNEQASAELQHSLAGRLGTFFEPVSQWAGFDWQTNIALIGGFAAKEVIVSSLGTAYSLGEVNPEQAEPLAKELHKDPDFTVLTGASLMVFVLLYAPCFVTVVTLARESSWKWAGFSMAFNTLLAFAVAVGVYQIGIFII